MNWSDFIQNTVQSVVGAGAAVYVAKNTPPQSVNPSGLNYVDGQAKIIEPGSIGGLSPTVLIAGGAAVLLLAVVLLKN